mgnify:CR=1 FL=1
MKKIPLYNSVPMALTEKFLFLILKSIILVFDMLMNDDWVAEKITDEILDKYPNLKGIYIIEESGVLGDL